MMVLRFGVLIAAVADWFQIIRLARKLPTGDLTSLKGKEAEEHDLDEDDLT